MGENLNVPLAKGRERRGQVNAPGKGSWGHEELVGLRDLRKPLDGEDISQGLVGSIQEPRLFRLQHAWRSQW
jgi:hypothetical protein